MILRSYSFASMMALVAVAGLSGCSMSLGGNASRVTKSFDAKVAAQSPADLHVNVPIGDVIIKPGAAGSTEVAVTGTLGGDDQATLDAVSVSVTHSSEGITNVVAKGPNGKAWKADLTISVPPKTSLTLIAGVGSVHVSELEGKIKADLGVGNLNVDSAVLTGDSSITVGTGNMSLGITSWAKETKIEATSGVGNATVQLPFGVGMNVDASTGTGNLNSSGLTFQGNPKSKSLVGGSLKGRTESDPEGRILKVSSGTGNVKIVGQSSK